MAARPSSVNEQIFLSEVGAVLGAAGIDSGQCPTLGAKTWYNH